MKGTKLIKVLGVVGTGLGFVATLISNYANEKELDNKVAKAVAEALEKTTKDAE